MADSHHIRWKAGNDVTLLENGVELFPALCEAFDAAVTSIHMETYIFRFDVVGKTILRHLTQAALRGVKVRVVLDGYGCAVEDEELQSQFQAAGAQCRIFRPEPKSFGLNGFNTQRLRRLHRKITTIDSQIAFIGGINIEDDYSASAPDIRLSDPRFDYAVRVTGPVVSEVVHAQDLLWLKTAWMNESAHLTPEDISRAAKGSRIWRHLHLRHLRFRRPLHLSKGVTHTGQIKAALLLRDNLRFRKAIESAYLSTIAQATDNIIIANAYFLPGHKLRKALIRAANRGVRVRLLLQGKIEYRMQYLATRWIYDQFLQAGIEIYEYLPSFLHAKVAVIDQTSTVGSSNLDPFSLLLAREANIMVEDAQFSNQLQRSLEHAITHGSHVVELTLYGQRGWLVRMGDACAYLLLRIGVALSGKSESY
jgi:cardiolipin synthase